MSFSFIAEKKLLPSEKKRRTKAPPTDETFHWFSLATPGPAYLGCVVRVTEVSDASNIKVVFFDPTTGTELAAVPATSVNLADLNIAFRGLPSTIDLPDPVQKDQFALLFFTEPWLTTNAKPVLDIINSNPAMLIKFPFAEDGFLVDTISELANGIRSLGKNPSDFPNYKRFTEKYRDWSGSP